MACLHTPRDLPPRDSDVAGSHDPTPRQLTGARRDQVSPMGSQTMEETHDRVRQGRPHGPAEHL
ncbi:MAG: hypothetical protein LBE67_15110 [Kocuria palustris]|nr:hypothetical protein [Kocuria palustris]